MALYHIVCSVGQHIVRARNGIAALELVGERDAECNRIKEDGEAEVLFSLVSEDQGD